MREKQEKAQDKMAELDALRAKRAYEAGEREARLKEKNELINKKKIMDELIANKNYKNKINLPSRPGRSKLSMKELLKSNWKILKKKKK